MEIQCRKSDILLVITYRQHRYLLDALCFTEAEKHQFTKVMNCEMDDVTAQDALKNLSYYLHHYWKKQQYLSA